MDGALLMRGMFVLVLALAGCLRDTQFRCETDAQCGDGGRCDETNTCRFPDQPDPDPDPDPGVCPAGFAPLANGTPGHRYLLVGTTATWTDQVAACTASGVYLAIPNDAAELAAIAALNGSNKLWLGIDDRANEGDFVDAKGAVATFLPWKDGSPDDEEDDRDCVAADSASEIVDDSCEQEYVAVCECDG